MPRGLRSLLIVGMLLSLMLTAGCTVKAPPAPQSTETSKSPTPPPPKATHSRTQVPSDAGMTRR